MSSWRVIGRTIALSCGIIAALLFITGIWAHDDRFGQTGGVFLGVAFVSGVILFVRWMVDSDL